MGSRSNAVAMFGLDGDNAFFEADQTLPLAGTQNFGWMTLFVQRSLEDSLFAGNFQTAVSGWESRMTDGAGPGGFSGVQVVAGPVDIPVVFSKSAGQLSIDKMQLHYFTPARTPETFELWLQGQTVATAVNLNALIPGTIPVRVGPAAGETDRQWGLLGCGFAPGLESFASLTDFMTCCVERNDFFEDPSLFSHAWSVRRSFATAGDQSRFDTWVPIIGDVNLIRQGDASIAPLRTETLIDPVWY